MIEMQPYKIAEDILKEKRSNKHRDNFFPLLIDKLNLKTGVEIGVDKAEFSVKILEKSKIEQYYCVDCWMDDFGSDFKKDKYDKVGNNRFKEAAKNLSPWLNKSVNRAKMVKMTGCEASKYFKTETLDFVYIDGDHTLEGVYMDLKCWLPKLKINGIIAGHDYKDGINSGINGWDGKQLPYGVKSAVDFICARYGYKLNIVGGRILSWWFVKDRTTVDATGYFN